MADLSKYVEIIFGMDDRASGPMKSLASDFQAFDATVQSVAAPLADVANKVLAAETAVLALSAAFVGKAIESAGKFGDSVREIGTLFGGTTDQVNQFGTDIQNYAAGSTQSIESINGAIYEAISSGVKYEDSIKFINEAEKLSVAGRADLQQVTSVMTGVLNAYGASTDQAAQYTDDLYTAVLNGKTTVPELASSLGNIVGITANVGVGFDELSAAIAALTASSVKTPEAITGIKAAISNILSPSKEAADAAKEMGIQFDGSALKTKGLAGVLAEVQEKTGGNTDSIKRLFGSIEGYNAALILGADKTGIFAKSLQDMANNSGATEKAFQAMSQNYEVALQRMGNAADVAMIKAGKPLLDEFGGVANGIASVFQNLGKGIDSGAFDPIINALEAFGQSASDTLGNIAKNLPDALAALDFGPLLESLKNLGGSVGGAFDDIFGNIDLNTPEGLASALQSIVNGIAGLTNVTSGIIDSFEPIFTALGDLAREAGSAGAESQTAAGQFLGVAQQIVSFGTGLTAALTLFQETGTSVVSVIDVFAGGVKIAFNGVQIALDGVGAVILSVLQKIAQGFALVLPGDIGDKWANKAAEFGGLLDDLKERTDINTQDMADGWDKVQRGLDGVGQKASGTADNMEVVAESSGEAAVQGEKFTAIDWSQSATGIDYVGEAAKRLGISVGEAGPPTEEFSKYIRSAADEADIARAKTSGYRLEIDELGNRTYTPVVEGAKKTGQEVNKAAKEMEEAAKKAVQYDLELQKIASAERIAYIEAKFKLDEAQIQADTQRVTAAFESINTSISSTGETLSGLISSWAGMDSSFESAKLWNLIEKEEQRREDAFQQQKILLDEQIKYMQARTLAMLRGETMLKVEAAGLAPHLERIFLEILRACQVKANEQGLELLLGATV